MSDMPETRNAGSSGNRQALFLLGIISLMGILLLGIMLIPAFSSDTLELKAIKFSISNSVAEPVVYVVIFGICCFLATKVRNFWAAAGGLPFLALALMPFVADGERSEIQKQVDKLLTESAAQKIQLESVGTLVGDLKQSVSNAKIELVNCKYPYDNGWWHGYDAVMNKRCPANQVIVGGYSQHDNDKEDRVRKYLCCSMRVVTLP